MNWPMRDLLGLIWMLVGLFRSRTSLRAENLALRHQLNVLYRRSPKRPVFSNFDRLIFICLYRIAPRILDALTMLTRQPLFAGIALAFGCSGSGSLDEEPAGPRCFSKFGS